MAATMTEYEWEALPELEDEGEDEAAYEAEFELEEETEDELEAEGEAEAEEFFRQLAQVARRVSQSPTLQRVGQIAARSALGGLAPVAMTTDSATPAQRIGNRVGAMLSDVLAQQEGEYEDEYEVNPIARIYPEVLMEHLGHGAAVTESEAEAEAMIGAIVPIAARLAPRAARVVARATPQLSRGLTNVARTLRRSRATRPLVRALPTVARRTVRTLARQVARGRPVTPRTAVRTLARQTARVLGSPRQSVHAYRRSRAMDRRYHRAAGAHIPWRPATVAGIPRTRQPVRTHQVTGLLPAAARQRPTAGLTRRRSGPIGSPASRTAMRSTRAVVGPITARRISGATISCCCRPVRSICMTCGGLREF